MPSSVTKFLVFGDTLGDARTDVSSDMVVYAVAGDERLPLNSEACCMSVILDLSRAHT